MQLQTRNLGRLQVIGTPYQFHCVCSKISVSVMVHIYEAMCDNFKTVKFQDKNTQPLESYFEDSGFP